MRGSRLSSKGTVLKDTVILNFFLKIDLWCHIVMDQENHSNNILEKVIFYFLSSVSLNWGFVS